MSIIAEALKKAKKERESISASWSHQDKHIVIEEKVENKNGGLDDGRAQLGHNISSFSPKKPGSNRNKIKVLMGSIALLLLAGVFLTVINRLLLPSLELTIAKYDKNEDDITAETYTTMKSDIIATEEKSNMRDMVPAALKSDLIRGEFLTHFTLNGIVYDKENSWAIVNNKVVGTGDVLDGAEVISIAPKGVVFLFKNEKFDLRVK